MELREMTEAEQKYTYRQSHQLDAQTGCIGYLRGDFGTTGKEFYSSWFNNMAYLKTPEFRAELDQVINALREDSQYGGILADRSSLSNACRQSTTPKFGRDEFGFRVNTQDYAYLLRLNPSPGDYNFYVYCYKRDYLDRNMRNAEYGMSYSGEAADQVVRLSLNGVEVAAKLSGSAAKQLAIMIYAILKDQKKTKGKIRLTNMLRSGKELKVFAVKDGDLQKFCEEAKKYGVLYCVLKDKNASDGITDIMVRAEDAAKVNRIFTRFGLATVDLASLKTELVKEQDKDRTEEDADVRSGSDKPHNDDFVKELFGEDPEKHIVEENPLTGRTEAERPSESTSLNRWGEEIFLDPGLCTAHPGSDDAGIWWQRE